MKKLNRICFGWIVLVTSVVSAKQLLWDWGGGGIWEFSLVKGSKIHLHHHWYRLRVPGSQLHILTQKFQKKPPVIFKQAGVVCHFESENSTPWLNAAKIIKNYVQDYMRTKPTWPFYKTIQPGRRGHTGSCNQAPRKFLSCFS